MIIYNDIESLLKIVDSFDFNGDTAKAMNYLEFIKHSYSAGNIHANDRNNLHNIEARIISCRLWSLETNNYVKDIETLIENAKKEASKMDIQVNLINRRMIYYISRGDIVLATEEFKKGSKISNASPLAKYSLIIDYSKTAFNLNLQVAKKV